MTRRGRRTPSASAGPRNPRRTGGAASRCPTCGARATRRAAAAARAWAASLRATRAVPHEMIRRRPSSAAPRSGESTSAGCRDRLDERRHGSVRPRATTRGTGGGRRRRGVAGCGRGRTAPATSGRRRRPLRPVARSSTTGRSPTRYTDAPSTTMRWRHCSHSAKHIAAGNNRLQSAQPNASTAQPVAAASDQFAGSRARSVLPRGYHCTCASVRHGLIVGRLRADLKTLSRIRSIPGRNHPPCSTRPTRPKWSKERPDGAAQDHQRRRPRRRARAPLRALAAGQVPRARARTSNGAASA